MNAGRQQARTFARVLALTSIVTAAAAGGCATAPPRAAAAPAASPAASAETFVRVRCATDGRDSFTTWRGRVWAFVPGEAPRELFGIVGMNVARCWQEADGTWAMTSRELMLYLDPATGEVVDRWVNPFTGETVPVMHVANRQVQARFASVPPLVLAGGLASFVIDVPVFYPNRLAQDPAFAAYAPAPNYQAGEFFVLSADAAALAAERGPGLARVALSWHRVGPWLPWMKMGDRPGQLVYSALGEKVRDAAALPGPLRAVLGRVPLYGAAPRCFLAGPNATSWSVFAAQLPAYLAGERFPRPESADDDTCREETP